MTKQTTIVVTGALRVNGLLHMLQMFKSNNDKKLRFNQASTHVGQLHQYGLNPMKESQVTAWKPILNIQQVPQLVSELIIINVQMLLFNWTSGH